MRIGSLALNRIRPTRILWAAVLGVAFFWTSMMPANAQEFPDFSGYTRATFDQWLAKYKDAKPEFKPGDVLTANDIEKMRPFMPPGFIEQLNFPEFKAEIIAPRSHKPRADYVECSEKYQNQTRLNADGAMANYVCGQAFPNSQITLDDPTAGTKAAWNFDYRWQNYGLFITNVGWIWDRFGGAHVAPALTKPPELWLPFSASLPSDLTDNFKGGGTFQRTLQGPYERVYYTHLAPLSGSGGVLPVPNAADFEFKEFTGFHEPFDIRGTAFIIYRYADPHRADDAWAYIPNLRRVRRITAEVKSDSLLGTDHTLEDFYGFSGRPIEWNWRFLGWKDMLAIHDSKYDDSHFYGPNGMIPNDVWSLRHFAVVERTPKDPRAPYNSAVDFWDAENWETFWMEAWDHKDKLWKLWYFYKVWTEDIKEPSRIPINKGTYVTYFQSIEVMDLQNKRGTFVPCYGGGYPNIRGGEAERLYDINKLEQLHR